MNFSYQLYQAERVMSAGEQRDADTLAGELAAGFARLRRAIALTYRQPLPHTAVRHRAPRAAR